MDLRLRHFAPTYAYATATILVLLAVGSAAAQKLQVDLYYESRCPDCDEFIVTDIHPVWMKLGGAQHLSLNLVPYGNARMNQAPDRNVTITCQHGPDECKGNVLHNCALKHIPTPDLQLAFITCTFFSNAPHKAGGPCAKLLKLDFPPIRNCTQNGEGERLHYQAGVRTEALQPPHQWVPWLIFDGVYNAKDMQDAQEDFLGFVCGKLKGKGATPAACGRGVGEGGRK